MKRASLRLKLTVLLIGAIVVMLGIFVSWNTVAQRSQAEREMLEKAQILSDEMDAVWKFFEVNQHQFEVDKDGNEGLYCVIAAKAVSKFFTEDTNYIIHYTNLSTRRPADTPDAFEVDALQAMHANPQVSEYYRLELDAEQQQVFRYAKPLFITESCLECHGDPAGELDQFGFAKEGLQKGDIAGAISIVMPIDIYLNSISNNINQGMITIALVAVVLFAVITFGVSRLVLRPLREFEAAAESIEGGDLNVNLEGIGGRDEIHDLALRFNSMAKQLKNLYDDLESQVETRTGQLAFANRELEMQRQQLEDTNLLLLRTSEYKSDFLAIMSHELRTPLTSILAYTELWELPALPSAEEERAVIQEIQANGHLLLNMVDNILEMARMESGRVELICEPVDMVDLVHMTENTLHSLANRRNIELSCEVSTDVPLINADWEKLRRIIVNLASNAIKFTKKGGQVSIRVTYLEDRASIKLLVSDNGIGIREEDVPSIFERFTQSEQSSMKRYSGSGLGLAVVRELVEILHGSITVESEHKKGSRFAVIIPVGDNDWEAHDEDNAG
ncbi:MAG: DUF3365 domain-containing protein [Coriobacteriales bacterium]|jgi:signal transduction histidine kinase|nr:DUF3365 domain-containing protein [Coriobacteriales bacterium]